MGSALKLREDFSAVELRRLARVTKDVRQTVGSCRSLRFSTG